MTRAPARNVLAGILWLLAAAFCGPVLAFEPELPAGARLTVERNTAPDSFDVPLGPFAGGSVPGVRVEGEITRRAWRIDAADLAPLQVLLPLREQLTAQGYRTVFECAARECGGFDFRFETEVLPGPNMYVNLSRYRYLTALTGPDDAPAEAVGILISSTSGATYVQVIHADTGVDINEVVPRTVPVTPATDSIPQPPAATDPASGPVTARVTAADLEIHGFTVLDDLDFATGSTDLGPGPFRSLEDLAQFLQDTPEARIALVGHTDTVGGLAPNIALSRARAQSVRARLISQYGIDDTRLDAEGMGYLAPLAPNSTSEGRALNRRVEAVLLGSN